MKHYTRLVVEDLTVEDIWKDDVKGVKVNGARNVGQGHRVIEEKHYAKLGGCRPYS